MKSSVISLAIISAVAFGTAPHDAVAKDAKTKSDTMQCPSPAKSLSQKWNWKSAHLVANISSDDEIQIDEKNSHEKLPIASITKLMTAYLVLQKVQDGTLNPKDLIPVRESSLQLQDSCFAIGILPKDIKQISVEDALTHLLYLSSNPMAENLAVKVAGNQDDFVKQMNAQAKEWGMENTHFVNVHGLPEGNRKSEHTTANDLLKMAHHLLPYMDDYQYYEHRPLEVDGVALKTKKPNPWKQKFIDMGYLFKTATIADCRSLMTFAKSDYGHVVSIQLCGNKKEDRFAVAMSNLNRAFKELTQIKSAEAATQSNEMSP